MKPSSRLLPGNRMAFRRPWTSKNMPVCDWQIMALLLFTSQAAALADESYVMDGKPVTRAFYNSNLLVNDSIQLLRANRNQEASEKLRQAVALAPEYPEAHYNYGLALAKIGHVPEAIEQMQAAVTLNPGLQSSWITLAALFQASGRVDEAIK